MPPFLDNISNLQEINDFGIKISKLGFNALTASDKDLIYNSSWPSMQIVKVIKFDATTFSFPHDLGFPPFAILIRSTTNFDQGGAMTNLPCDELNVYIPFVWSGAGTIIIYNIDVSTDVEYPYTTQVSSENTYNFDYGIKMTKLGANIDSEDMRDYILHTRCGSPLILAVKTEKTSNPSNPSIVQYTSKLGYPTLNFGYVKIIDSFFLFVDFIGQKRYYHAPLQSQAYPWTVTDGVTSYVGFGEGTSDGGTIVCLRNPNISITNIESVTY
jgi:hypothetical protein